MNDKAVEPFAKVSLKVFPEGMVIIKKWSGFEGVVMMLMGMFGVYYIHHEYEAILVASNIEEHYLILLFIVTGVAFFYYLSAQLFNRTMIKLDSKLLMVQHGPVPWLGNILWPAADLQEVYVKMETEDNNSQDNDEGRFYYDDHGADTSIRYAIHAITNSGKNIKLLNCDENLREALYIEEKVEDYLQNIRQG